MHLHDVFNESDSKLSFDWKILKIQGLKYIYIYLPNKLKVKHILRPRFNNLMYLMLFWLLPLKRNKIMILYIDVHPSWKKKAQCIFKYYPGIPQLH